MKDIMCDIETLGTRAGAVILAIGAVEFDMNGLGKEFYEVVNTDDAMQCGLFKEQHTVDWWQKQSMKARRVLMLAGSEATSKPLGHVLSEFKSWIGSPTKRLWGNGAAFDNALIAEAAERVGQQRPVFFWNDMCFRTLKTLVKLDDPITPVIAHHALEDAKAQAHNAITILKRLGISLP